jgi:adenylylsulfate kinase
MESRKVSILKAITWRGGGTLLTMLIVYIFTRRWEIVGIVSIGETAVKLMAYYIHERIWALILKKRKKKC